jgi:hypothetical protein
MKAFRSHKVVHAAAMILSEYYKEGGRKLSPNLRLDAEGYKVVYDRGSDKEYTSWSPKEPFDDGYSELGEGNVTFSAALIQLKNGKRIARKNWNGKGMFVYLVPANKYPAAGNKNSILAGMYPDDMVPYNAYMAIVTPGGNVSTWVPSSTDTLAEDWHVVERD